MQTKNAVTENNVKKGNVEGVENVQEIVVAQVNNRTKTQIEKSAKYDKEKAGSFDALLQSARDTDLENASFGKKINHFLDSAVKRLTEIGVKPEKLELMTFGNVRTWKDKSEKYGALEYISTHQAKLIVNGYLKSIDGNIARGERVAKQGGTTGKNADKQQRRGAKNNAK